MTFQAEDLATWKPGVSGRFETFGGKRFDQPASDELVRAIQACVDAGRSPMLRTHQNNLFSHLYNTPADPRGTNHLKPKDRYLPYWEDLGEDFGEWTADLLDRVNRTGDFYILENNEAQLVNDRDPVWFKPIGALWSAYRKALGAHKRVVKVCAYDDFGDLPQRLAAEIYDYLLVAAYPAFIGKWSDSMPDNCVPIFGGWVTDNPRGNENVPTLHYLDQCLSLLRRLDPPFAAWFDMSKEQQERSHMLRDRLPSSGDAPVAPDRPPPPRPDTAREIALERVRTAQMRLAEVQGVLDQAAEALK